MLKSDAHAKISAANQLLLDIREKPYIEPTHLLRAISHLNFCNFFHIPTLNGSFSDIEQIINEQIIQ